MLKHDFFFVYIRALFSAMKFDDFFNAFTDMMRSYCFSENNSQVEVANRSDICAKYFNVVLNRNKSMGLKTFFKLVTSVGVNPQDILDLVQKGIEENIEELKKRKK